MFAVSHNARMTRGTTGRVNADGIVHVTSYETEGIVLAQVLFCGERNLTQVVEAIDGVGSDAELAQTFLVERGLKTHLDGSLQFL